MHTRYGQSGIGSQSLGIKRRNRRHGESKGECDIDQEEEETVEKL